MTYRAAASMSDSEIASELAELNAKWDDLRRELDDGHGGSPGEWMVERMGELEHEYSRRLERRANGEPCQSCAGFGQRGCVICGVCGGMGQVHADGEKARGRDNG